MMDGTIQVESEVNKGSKFIVTIFLKLPDTIYPQEKINRTEMVIIHCMRAAIIYIVAKIFFLLRIIREMPRWLQS